MAYLNEYYKKMFLDKIAYTSFNIFVEMLFSALFFLKKGQKNCIYLKGNIFKV